MDKRKATLQRAEDAERLVEGLASFWDEVEAEIHRMWEVSGSDQKDTREDLYRELHALRSVKAKIEDRIRKGRIAEHEMRREKDGDRHQ